MHDYTITSWPIGGFNPADIALNDPILGLDTEYTGGGIYAQGAQLRLVQLATAHDAYVFDMSDLHQRGYARDILSDQTRTFVAHNSSGAEVPAIARGLGVDISRRVIDTLILGLLAEPGEMKKHGLKDYALRLGQAGADLLAAEQVMHDEFKRLWKARPEYKRGGTDKEITTHGFTTVHSQHPAYRRYAGLDALCGRRLLDVLLVDCRVRAVTSAIGFEQKVNGVAARMALRGWTVDTERVQHILATVGEDNAQHKADYLALTGHLPGSHAKKRARLEERGVEFKVWNKPTKQDERGPNLGREALRELYDEYPFAEVKMLLDFAETSNATNFLTGLINHVDSQSRVHANIRTLGAVSGRWTVSNPGVQTVSNSSGTRSVFTPSTPGHVLLSADLGQIEPRVAFTLAHEDEMIKLMRSGEDAYSAAAKMIFGPGFTKFQRKLVKRIILGTMYAAGIDVLVRQAKYMDGWADANPRAISEARQQFKDSNPRMARYATWLQEQPDVRLPSGRYGPHDPRRLYRGINTMVQGTARDVLMQRYVDLSDAGFDDCLVMTFHDEVMLDIARSEVMEASWTVRDIMEQGFQGTPTPCDLEMYTENWGQKPLVLSDAGVYSGVTDRLTTWEDWK